MGVDSDHNRTIWIPAEEPLAHVKTQPQEMPIGEA